MKNLLRAGFAALAVSALMVASGSAMAGDRPDKEDGEATIAGAGPAAKDAALSAAIADWKREVAEETGVKPRWKTASDKETDCEIDRDGTTECEVEARPAH
jgi:hypothetical protein